MTKQRLGYLLKQARARNQELEARNQELESNYDLCIAELESRHQAMCNSLVQELKEKDYLLSLKQQLIDALTEKSRLQDKRISQLERQTRSKGRDPIGGSESRGQE